MLSYDNSDELVRGCLWVILQRYEQEGTVLGLVPMARCNGDRGITEILPASVLSCTKRDRSVKLDNPHKSVLGKWHAEAT